MSQKQMDANAGPPLRKRDLATDPVEQFDRWYGRAIETEPAFPEAVTLATTRSDGTPAARVVLLKDFDARGFTFFTNYRSHKAAEIDANPRATLLFWWRASQRQVRIEGRIEKVSAEESDTYFATRPRGSQLSAWASEQSREVETREILENRMADLEREYEVRPIDRPPHWGGYRVVPDRFEFWQGRENRLHDRFVYLPAPGNGWRIIRISP